MCFLSVAWLAVANTASRFNYNEFIEYSGQRGPDVPNNANEKSTKLCVCECGTEPKNADNEFYFWISFSHFLWSSAALPEHCGARESDKMTMMINGADRAKSNHSNRSNNAQHQAVASRQAGKQATAIWTVIWPKQMASTHFYMIFRFQLTLRAHYRTYTLYTSTRYRVYNHRRERETDKKLNSK